MTNHVGGVATRLVDPLASPSRFAGMRIGLFGGSFDPAHEGHRHVAATAAKRLDLHQIWWIPTAAHPFKNSRRDFTARLASVKRVATGPSMRVSDIEARQGIAASVALAEMLKTRLADTRLVWLVGEDVLLSLHLWTRWTALVRSLPIAVIARPGCGARAGLSRFAVRYRDARLPECSVRALPVTAPPAWVRISAPYNHAASSRLAERETIWR